MADYYIATLKLVCSSTSSSFESEFDDRWTRRLERAWEAIPIRTTLPLESVLSGRIWEACRTHIESDLGELGTGVESVLPGQWGKAPAGRFVQMAPLKVKFPNSNSTKPWIFSNGDGDEAEISIYASFIRVST